MSPSNKHELEIARAMDKFALEGRLSPPVTYGVIDELPTNIVLRSEMDSWWSTSAGGCFTRS